MRDTNDIYGLSYRSEGCSLVSSLYALGVSTIEVRDNQIEMVLYTDRNVSVFEKVCKMLQNSGTMRAPMNAESWRTVMPVFCDVTLGTKMARDEESREMIELVLNSRYIDFAYLYDGWSGWSSKMADFIAGEGVFASTYEKSAKVIKKYYEKVLKFFYE